MADVPDQPVARRVEQVVQRDGELDDAEPGAEMAAGHRDRADGLGPQFVGNLPQLLFVQPAQIGRALDGVQKWSGYRHDRNNIVASSHTESRMTPSLP